MVQFSLAQVVHYSLALTRIRLMQNREQSKERKDNTRRKILIGSFYLEQANKNNSFDSIVKLMNSYLTRDSDRMLFDLLPIKKQ